MKYAHFGMFFMVMVNLSCSNGHHNDCNVKRVLEKFLLMCAVYPSGMKRETYGLPGFVPLWPTIYPQGNWVNKPSQTPLQDYFGTVAWQPQPKSFQVKNSFGDNGAGIAFPNLQQGQMGEGGEGQQIGQLSSNKENRNSFNGSGMDVQNEPQDLTAFNAYLNPIYADAEWQKSIGRWRRNPQKEREIKRFVAEVCCVSGCPFPDEYPKFDRTMNICGLR